MNRTQKVTLCVMLFLLPALFSQSHSETYDQEMNYPRRGTPKGDGIYWEIGDGGVWGAHEKWRILGTKEYDETGNLIDEDTYLDGSCVEKCEWRKIFEYGHPRSVQQTVDGGFIVTGGIGGVLLLKTDGQGNEEWRKKFIEGYGNSVQHTADGGFIVTGTGRGREGGDVLLLKTNELGYIDDSSLEERRNGTIVVYGLYTISFYNSTETELRIDFSIRFLDSSGKEIAEPFTHHRSPVTIDARKLIEFPDVPFSAEFPNLTEVEKLDVVTVFSGFDIVDDLSDVTIVSDYTILGGVPDTFALLPCYPNPFNATTTIWYDLPTDAQVLENDGMFQQPIGELAKGSEEHWKVGETTGPVSV